MHHGISGILDLLGSTSQRQGSFHSLDLQPYSHLKNLEAERILDLVISLNGYRFLENHPTALELDIF